MATEGIRIAVVGLGFGRLWVPSYLGLPDVTSVGICDIDPEKLQRVGDEFGIEQRHTFLEEVLDSDEYDAVHLLTPIPLHADQSVAVLESGKHCACAIPMTISGEEIDRVVEAQRRTGKRYMLMETEIYSRTFLYVRRLYEQGAFGELQFLRGAHYQNMEGWPDYWQGLPPMYYSYHALGPAFFLAGSAPNKVHCLGSGQLPPELRARYGNPFPVETAIFQFAQQELACEVTICLFKMARSFLVDRFCVYGDLLGMEYPQIAGEKLAFFQTELGPLKPGQRGRNVRPRREAAPPLAELVPDPIAEFVRSSSNPRVIAIAHEFIRSIVEDRSPEITLETAANWTSASLSAHASALAGGEAVPIPNL